MNLKRWRIWAAAEWPDNDFHPVHSMSHHLTLLEEFLLLALDETTGDFYPLARSTFDCATAGVVLMDLTLRNRIDNDVRQMFVIDPTPTGEPLLDSTLQVMAIENKPEPMARWLRQLGDEGEALRESALRHMEQRGILGREDKKILWVFSNHTHPVIDKQEQNALKSRILGVVLHNDIPIPHDVVLVALAQACGLFSHLLSDDALNAALPRIEKVSKLDLIGQAVAQTVLEIEATIAMASGFR